MTEKEQRLAAVNEMIRCIGDNGRRFFRNDKHDRYASMEVDSRGRVWFIDDYTGARIYTHYQYDWKRFSHGGTMRRLVNAFREFIQSGKKLPSGIFGPWPVWYCSGDLWGYGDDMQTVREKSIQLGLIASEEVVGN